MNTKRREDSFFGLHFDFHATPKEGADPIGGRLTEGMIREICEKLHPDFLQVDCKGHPGWASYPSKLGNGISPMAQDTLKLWRRVTKEYGIALYMHYSGVVDGRYAALHPEECRWTEKLEPDTQVTSVFGSYADDVLIPQMLELAGDYGVDGIWIDGECWGTDTDYSPRALQKFFEETGIDVRTCPPVTRDMPYWNELREFCREGFRRYVRYYVDKVHAQYPDFQIASNWAFTDHMPEKVSANVDFLSGDYSPADSVNTARYCGRIIEAQDMPWDLMAWNFRCSVEPGLKCPKHPVQIEQEAAAVLSLGGGFQNYISQQRDGTPRMAEIRPMESVAAFCRAREPWCHKGRMVPQTVIFNSRHDHYLTTERIFHNRDCEALRGWTQLLCEDQQSVEIRSEHNFLEEAPNRFPLAVVSDIQTELDADAAKKLLAYAENGGHLVISGEKALDAMAAAGLPVTMKSGTGEDVCFITTGDGMWTSVCAPALEICAEGTVLASGCVNMSGEPEPIFPVVVEIPVGQGTVTAVGFNMGRSYYDGMSAALRRLAHTIRVRAYRPVAEVTGSRFCDASVLKKDGKLLIQLVNTCGGHGDAREMTIDEIPPVGPLHISIGLDKAPKAVILRPEGRILPGEYRDGRFETELDRLHIHEILEVVKA